MKRIEAIEATSYDPATKVAIWDFSDSVFSSLRSRAVNLAIALDLAERTARFFISGITGDALCDVEISVKDFKRIFPRAEIIRPGYAVNLDLGGPVGSSRFHLEDVLEGHRWSHNTLEGSLGPSPTPPKDPRIGAEVSFDGGTWGTIEEIWPPNSRRDYEAFWVRDEDGGEHELTESRVEFTSSITS